MASRQVGTLLDGLLKKLESVVEFLLLQRIHPLEDKRFRLRKVRTELVQPSQLFQFLLCSAGVALGTQGDTQVVVGFFEVGLQLNGSPKRYDRASRCPLQL